MLIAEYFSVNYLFPGNQLMNKINKNIITNINKTNIVK